MYLSECIHISIVPSFPIRFPPRVSVAIFISFLARALSSIHSELFCYTAISSAGIVCILPGYLICKRAYSILEPAVFLIDIIFLFSEQLSGTGLEEYALWLCKDGLRLDLYSIPRVRSPDWL